MKRIVFIMAAVMMMSNAVRACDACGCAAGSQYIGLLPGYSRNFIGLQQQYSALSGLYPSAYVGRPDDRIKDSYNTFQLWGRYGLGKHYQLFAFVPYQYNRRSNQGVQSSNAGLGDVSFLLNRIVVNKDTKEWKHALTAGAGLKLPTGKYNNISVPEDRLLPNIQPGTGSWDFTTNANYTLRYHNSGVNADASYSLTTVNKYSYKYGNRLATGIAYFHTLYARQFTIIPQLGARYEYALHDYDNYDKRWLNEESGGYMLFATAGAQAYYKKFGARFTYQLPVSQRFGGGDITAVRKVETSVFFLF